MDCNLANTHFGDVVPITVYFGSFESSIIFLFYFMYIFCVHSAEGVCALFYALPSIKLAFLTKKNILPVSMYVIQCQVDSTNTQMADTFALSPPSISGHY